MYKEIIKRPKMKSYSELFSLFPYITISLLSLISLADSSAYKYEPFLRCLSCNLSQNSIQSPHDASYVPILNSTIMNPRTFLYTSSQKPFLIVTPLDASQVQATVVCARKHRIEIRTRSGGHDSEGLSYLSPTRFVLLDLARLRMVKVNAAKKTAWVESGATLGEIYHGVAKKSDRLAFPAGVCYTVGAGGHFSGGGYGYLLRKYGLAADNIVDARIVDASGRILNAKSMGKDLFWAIRGGGAASFGVVLSWKIRLVDVPPRVTVFNVARDLGDKKTKEMVHRWQSVAHTLPQELTFFVRALAVNSTIQAQFFSVFLGGGDELFRMMKKSFPELGLVRKDCVEMRWIDVAVVLNGFPAGSSPDVLLDRSRAEGRPMSFVAKADFVERAVPARALERLWESLLEDDEGVNFLQLFPYGGKMGEIPESEIPFPHRKGNLYELSYISRWDERGDLGALQRHTNWTRSVHAYMTSYVSHDPRGAYLNYRDLDLGKNNDHGPTSFEQASTWARSYFKGNFERLAEVKAASDPTNFFKNEQSIVPFRRHH